VSKKSDTPVPAIDFEAALAELEGLVTRMESGDLPLDEALRQFERGVELTRLCQQALKDAELKVQVLLERQGKESLENFDPDA